MPADICRRIHTQALVMHQCTNITPERLHYATGVFMIIDLISIIPLFFPFVFVKDFAMLKIFRLLSIFKLERYARHSGSLELLRRVIFKKKEIFTIMIFFLVFIILFSSTIMYLVEYEAQPANISSIPAGNVVGDDDCDHGRIRGYISGNSSGKDTGLGDYHCRGAPPCTSFRYSRNRIYRGAPERA